MQNELQHNMQQDVIQPTLWDNIDLTKGLFYLANLEFDEAIIHLTSALKDKPKDDEILKAIESAQFWKPRVLKTEENDVVFSSILKDFIEFPFLQLASSFRKNLLYSITDRFPGLNEENYQEAEMIFDLLISAGCFERAVIFVSKIIEDNPDKYEWLYFLAQAQWLKGSPSTANQLYIQALLHEPGNVLINRIESEVIRNLISAYGVVRTPAFAWIKGVALFVNCDLKDHYLDESHQKAVQSYKFLQQAHECFGKGDLKNAIRYRKQLKELDGDLYEAYYSLLQ